MTLVYESSRRNYGSGENTLMYSRGFSEWLPIMESGRVLQITQPSLTASSNHEAD